LLFVMLAFLFGGFKSKINFRLNRGEQKFLLLLLIFFANFFYFLFSNLLFAIFHESQAIPFVKILFLTFYNSCYSVIIILLIFLIDNLQISIKKAR
jgi:hypothetical protein